MEYSDFSGCMSDGETIEEAIANGGDALLDCADVDVFKESGRKIPQPIMEAGQWRQRLPRTLYSKLTRQAESEGVSINSLVTAIRAEADRAQVPATILVREAIDSWLREQWRKTRHGAMPHTLQKWRGRTSTSTLDTFCLRRPD